MNTHELSGKRYTATVPDTLDLADRARLAINGIGGSIDPSLMTMYGLIFFDTPTPHQSHWASAETLCDPKFGESLPLMRLMSGSEQYLDLEAQYRQAMRSRVQDGLYWDFYTPKRPWRNSYSEAFYGKGRDEDFATLPGAGRMLRALLVWRELGDDRPETEEAIRSLTAGLLRIAVKKDGYCYYPEKGGWGEPCSYPRSGWLNTDEAQGETEGGEGSVVCMHGHQIYGAAHWYAESGDPLALDLAARLTRYVMLPKFWGGVPDPSGERAGLMDHIGAHQPDPAFTAGWEQGHWYSHFHARAIALRGILEFARFAGDERAAEFVRRAYEYTLTQGIPRIGWINTYPAGINFMESCALGDLVGLGIRLTDAGLGDYWDDVDAVVRNQLVEQQLTRADLLEQVSQHYQEPLPHEKSPHPGYLCYDEVIPRALGVYAGLGNPTSISRVWVMHCCTGNATQGLYAAWEGAVREAGDCATVNLFLNRAARLLDVDSYLPYEGKVVIHNKSARRLAVRIPAWVNRRELTATIHAAPEGAGEMRNQEWIGRYLVFDDLNRQGTITLTFPLEEQTFTYTANARSPQEQVYTCTFRGSTLVDISPRDPREAVYPLYQRDHLRQPVAPLKQAERYVADRSVSLW
jgi:hypothetical protein